ncbi:MAG: RsmB/NOP family class I SAM-dependent RNA methyltransferase [Sphingomonas sp.]|uniref:RsmB/NOP family class I SAM-dependent RNA methyltransferase n=1 Tax=Sphingomonas sp. TaxID=28214 RepID=UPI0025E5C580|nr:RsmB/NOP family class I SAM-dependent RNA methyltransferase [Sphingomonas sp.]MBX9880496.1 RsmB/NOP family class I SAM-dependent RNA methyltransferase [Sphingomonas sp.]
MTPQARAQAAIELLDAIIAAAREGGAAADTLIARYFATRRYAGSKDRRAVRELVYAAIRRAGEVPVSGRAAMLGLAQDDAALAPLFDGGPHAPPPIAPGEPVAPAGIAPAWLEAALTESGTAPAEQAALVDRAPLDLRVNPARASVAQLRAALPEAAPIAGLPQALRLPHGTQVDQLDLYRAGGFEVQDAGSQLASRALPLDGQPVIDLCAGAGGKTLALAAEGAGPILACDVDRARLSRLAPRAERAGVAVETRLLDPGREAAALADWAGRADLVIDAPCSGSGTWRRNPEARWRLTPARLARLVATQAQLLALAPALVRPGGALLYITCSLLDVEGPAQIARFLADHPEWRAEPLALPLGRPHGPGWRLSPARDSTDGFFVARLRAPC